MHEPKQVIIVRKDLKMRKGKIVAQSCHASMKVILDAILNGNIEPYNNEGIAFSADTVLPDWQSNQPEFKAMAEWLNGGFAKICLYVNSLEELDDLYQQALDTTLPCAEIIDQGRTEFHGVPTKTCIAIGPCNTEDVDKITGNLKLL